MWVGSTTARPMPDPDLHDHEHPDRCSTTPVTNENTPHVERAERWRGAHGCRGRRGSRSAAAGAAPRASVSATSDRMPVSLIPKWSRMVGSRMPKPVRSSSSTALSAEEDQQRVERAVADDLAQVRTTRVTQVDSHHSPRLPQIPSRCGAELLVAEQRLGVSVTQRRSGGRGHAASSRRRRRPRCHAGSAPSMPRRSASHRRPAIADAEEDPGEAVGDDHQHRQHADRGGQDLPVAGQQPLRAAWRTRRRSPRRATLPSPPITAAANTVSDWFAP